jgi:hypothetical protein
MKFQLWDPSSMSQIVDPKTGMKTAYFFRWIKLLFDLLHGTIGQGYTGTVTVGKLTTGGTNGTLTLTNGVITNVVAPT